MMSVSWLCAYHTDRPPDGKKGSGGGGKNKSNKGDKPQQQHQQSDKSQHHPLQNPQKHPQKQPRQPRGLDRRGVERDAGEAIAVPEIQTKMRPGESFKSYSRRVGEEKRRLVVEALPAKLKNISDKVRSERASEREGGAGVCVCVGGCSWRRRRSCLCFRKFALLCPIRTLRSVTSLCLYMSSLSLARSGSRMRVGLSVSLSCACSQRKRYLSTRKEREKEKKEAQRREREEDEKYEGVREHIPFGEVT